MQVQATVQASQSTILGIATNVQLLLKAQQPRKVTKPSPNVDVEPVSHFNHGSTGVRQPSGQRGESTHTQVMVIQNTRPAHALSPVLDPTVYRTKNSDTLFPVELGSESSIVYRGTCRSWCSCKCHQMLRFNSMSSTMSALGFLFMCLSGGRYSLQSCDEPRCLRKQDLRMRLAYVFPPWLLAQALCVIFTISCLGKPKFTPRWCGTFSGDAKIFTFAIEGDLEGLRKLFEERAASPHDVAVSTGRTALHVSTFIEAFCNNTFARY